MYPWKHRGTSLLAKVMKCNTLIGLLFVNKMSVLPRITKDIIDQIDKLFKTFLWKGKTPKISLRTIQSPEEQGGLRLVELYAKDDTLKAKWALKCFTDPKIQSLASQFLFPGIGVFTWHSNLDPYQIKKMFRPNF